jgi:hypothetical protein
MSAGPGATPNRKGYDVKTEDTKNKEGIVILHDGSAVDEYYFNGIMGQILATVTSLEQGTAYSVESLLDEAFWSELTSHGRETARLCVATMVMDEMVPLAFSEAKHSYYVAPVASTGNAEKIRTVIASLFERQGEKRTGN